VLKPEFYLLSGTPDPTPASRFSVLAFLRGFVRTFHEPFGPEVEEGLKHAPWHPDDALVLAHPDAELDGRHVGIPSGVWGKTKEHAGPSDESPTPERCLEAYYLHRTRLELIAERKVCRRQLTEDGNIEITGRELTRREFRAPTEFDPVAAWRAAQIAAREIERRFPVRIRIAVPPTGLGKQLTQIHDWLDQNAGADGCQRIRDAGRSQLSVSSARAASRTN
jgi:hypothetical protein